MIFKGPFNLLNEKYNLDINVEYINIDIEPENILYYSNECIIFFYFNSNVDFLKLDNVFNINNTLFFCNEVKRKSDLVSNFKIFEYNDNKQQLTFELKNGLLSECQYEEDPIYCKCIFDYYLINNDSMLYQEINKEMARLQKLKDEAQEKILHPSKNNWYDNNESVWEHNVRHSFLPWDWFKNYKISKYEVL